MLIRRIPLPIGMNPLNAHKSRTVFARSPAPRLGPGIGQRRGRQPFWRSRIALDAAELVKLAFPRLAEGRDLFVAAADEVPPHDDVLLERRTAEQQDPRGLTGEVGQLYRGRAGRQVAELGPLQAGT